MIIRIQYQDDTDRQNAINANADKFLIEEDKITEGNFLIFSDIKPLDNQLQDLNNTANMILLKQEGII